jgi:hypothetical protein
VTEKAKGYEFEKRKIHQRERLCLDMSEEFLYDWTTSDKLEK